MSEDIKLFVSCHKLDTHIPDNALLQPIQVGAALAASRMPNLLHDDEAIPSPRRTAPTAS